MSLVHLTMALRHSFLWWISEGNIKCHFQPDSILAGLVCQWLINVSSQRFGYVTCPQTTTYSTIMSIICLSLWNLWKLNIFQITLPLLGFSSQLPAIKVAHFSHRNSQLPTARDSHRWLRLVQIQSAELNVRNTYGCGSVPCAVHIS